MKLVFAEFVGTFLLTSVVLGTNSNNPIGFFGKNKIIYIFYFIILIYIKI